MKDPTHYVESNVFLAAIERDKEAVRDAINATEMPDYTAGQIKQAAQWLGEFLRLEQRAGKFTNQ